MAKLLLLILMSLSFSQELFAQRDTYSSDDNSTQEERIRRSQEREALYRNWRAEHSPEKGKWEQVPAQKIGEVPYGYYEPSPVSGRPLFHQVGTYNQYDSEIVEYTPVLVGYNSYYASGLDRIRGRATHVPIYFDVPTYASTKLVWVPKTEAVNQPVACQSQPTTRYVRSTIDLLKKIATAVSNNRKIAKKPNLSGIRTKENNVE